MKYKNTTKGILRFRASDKSGQKQVFELKPGEEFESDRTVSLGGLEKLSKGARAKVDGKDMRYDEEKEEWKEEPKLKKIKESDKK